MPDVTIESLKVLVVEDNVHMRALIRSVLYALGVRTVLEAGDGESGFDQFRQENADLILTDLSMAPRDGIVLTRLVRNAPDSPNPYVPVIMVTAHTERHRVEAARDAGVTEFLAKPMTIHKLFLRLLEIVERPRAYIRCDDYFGPDRRRRIDVDHGGPWRRHEDRSRTVPGTF